MFSPDYTMTKFSFQYGGHLEFEVVASQKHSSKMINTIALLNCTFPPAKLAEGTSTAG